MNEKSLHKMSTFIQSAWALCAMRQYLVVKCSILIDLPIYNINYNASSLVSRINQCDNTIKGIEFPPQT